MLRQVRPRIALVVTVIIAATAATAWPVQAGGTWKPTGSMTTARYDHTATRLPGGRVLVAGGFDISTGYLASAEIYDPASGTWTSTRSTLTARAYHTATRLPDGGVLVIGGTNGSPLA